MTIYDEIKIERNRQDKKWGGQEHDDHHDPEDWCEFIIAYATWARQMAVNNSPEKYRRRLVQAAALAVAACESLDRVVAGTDSDVY